MIRSIFHPNTKDYLDKQEPDLRFQQRGLSRIKSRGFSLIELMIAVLIIMLLSGLVLVNVSLMRKKARDQKRIAEISIVAAALQAYFADKHVYPGGDWIAGWGGIGEAGQYPESKCVYVEVVTNDLKANGYLASCPQEPFLEFTDCGQFKARDHPSVTGVCRGVAEDPSHTYYNTPQDHRGYRYTCWPSESSTPPGDCNSYALSTVVELCENATVTEKPKTPTKECEYRLFNGEPCYSMETCSPI